MAAKYEIWATVPNSKPPKSFFANCLVPEGENPDQHIADLNAELQGPDDQVPYEWRGFDAGE